MIELQTLVDGIASRASEADKEGRFPAEDAQALMRSGYTVLNVPKELGGYGYNLYECTVAQLELAKASTSTALVAGMNMQVQGNEHDTRAWPEALYGHFVETAVREGVLINSAASEPRLGSPSRGGQFQTFADRSEDGQEWIINGHKNWITGGRHLTHIVVKLSGAEGNMTVFIPSNSAGVRWDETWGDSLSLRASDSHDLHLENVRIPIHFLAASYDAPKPPPNIWFPIVMSATYLGGAIGARDAVVRYALERVPTALGKPIATLPKIQRQIGEIDVALQAARALLLDVARMWKGGVDAESRQALLPRIAAAKVFATDTANMVTEKTLQIAGGASISKNLPLERFFRDVRAGAMHPPSGDSALELVGRAALDGN